MGEIEVMDSPSVSNKRLQQSMVTSKDFFRVSKKGKISKVVREHYLRNDIVCSSRLCTTCAYIAPPNHRGLSPQFVLSENPQGFAGSHKGNYLVPDTNIFYHCMEIVEHKAAFHDVIVLQTVFDELRNRSLPLHQRLRQLTKDANKRFVVFHNEFHAATYVEQNEGETINDRNDRAIRVATKWYQEHLTQTLEKRNGTVPNILLLSNDRDNVRKAVQEGCSAMILKGYLSKLADADELIDMLSSTVDADDKPRRAETSYPEYLPMSQLVSGVQKGSLLQGVFQVSRYNFLEASVSIPSYDRPPLVLGRENMNRAISGDVVVVAILPKDEWKLPPNAILEEENVTKNENPNDDNEAENVLENEHGPRDHHRSRLSSRAAVDSTPKPTARVVGIIKRNWRQYVGHIDAQSVAPTAGRMQKSVFLVPMDKTIPRIRIRTRQAQNLVKQRVVVSIDTWDRTSRYPEGHFVRTLGALETKEAETEAILMEHDVSYRPFPQAVLDCLPDAGHDWKVPQDKTDPEWQGREDLRHLLVCSIDPPACQDIDDALHARPLPNGKFEVGVHIADVTRFVKPGTPMDEEAAARGTTVYMVDKRIDMLPMLLGTDLCSLKPCVERLAFSTIWELSSEADIVDVRFTKSVIASKEAFSYEHAQLRIDDTSKTDKLTESMRILLRLSKILRQNRMEAGALNLASPEVRIQTESETSDPVDVEIKELKETNSLVEEFMLLANISVARKIYQSFPQTSMLRRHGAPPASNFEALQDALKVRKGMSLNTESSKALAASLDDCIDPKEPFFNDLVRIMATRCMMSAEYFCSGTQGYPEFRHYGLATEIYTHFTSPIRRYADIVAHRQLAAAIEYERLHPHLYDKDRLVLICQNINKRHRNGQFAGRASVEYYVGQTLKDRVLEQEGFVMKIFANGFVVFVPRLGIEGLIRVRDLADQEIDSEFDENNYELSLSAKSCQMKVALFDKVRVRVSVVRDQQNNRKVQLDLVDPSLL